MVYVYLHSSLQQINRNCSFLPTCHAALMIVVQAHFWCGFVLPQLVIDIDDHILIMSTATQLYDTLLVCADLFTPAVCTMAQIIFHMLTLSN